MFLFPIGLMMGAEFTLYQYIMWNEIPTVLGNLAGGLTLVGMVLYTPPRAHPAEENLRLIVHDPGSAKVVPG